MQFLLAQCHVALEHHSNILLTLFLAGLVSGLTHCAGMCGPFVAAQVQYGSDGGNEYKSETMLQRLSGVALLPYHLGRMTTYMTLGVIAALLSKQILGTPLQHWLAVVFLAIAGGVFIMSALPKSKLRTQDLHSHHGQVQLIARRLARIAKPLFAKPRGVSGYLLGALLGLLPCGVIFAALMVVATTGNPFSAALAMMLFTFGTLPALFFIGASSNFAYRQWPNSMRHIVRGVMVFNGMNLFALAGQLALT